MLAATATAYAENDRGVVARMIMQVDDEKLVIVYLADDPDKAGCATQSGKVLKISNTRSKFIAETLRAAMYRAKRVSLIGTDRCVETDGDRYELISTVAVFP